MNTEEWVVDKAAGIVKHTTGLTLSIEAGKVSNIEVMPPSVSTRELPRLIDEGERAYRNHKSVVNNTNTDNQAATQSCLPKKPVLGLRKKA